jgi:hypothetical protein
MAFSATLHIEGHPREQEGIKVISCEYGLQQNIDERGMPISKVSGGVIKIGLKNESDIDIMSWMIMQDAKKNGKIVFSSGVKDNQAFQTIEFSDAILYNYHQSFSEENEIIVTLSISCRILTISGSAIMNSWEFYGEG